MDSFNSPTAEIADHRLRLHIRQMLSINKTADKEFEFTDISPDNGTDIVSWLSSDGQVESQFPRINYNSLTKKLHIITMLTEIHNVTLDWMIQEFYNFAFCGSITPDEIRSLEINCGTTVGGFSAPYTSSRKEPDVLIRPRGLQLPTIVVETGCSESKTRLSEDKQLWVDGARSTIKLVIIMEWSRIQGSIVKGQLTVFRPGATAAQNFSIFPSTVSACGPNDEVIVTRDEVFGPKLPPSRDPNEPLSFRISNLRRLAEEKLVMQGLTPA